jgi:hypothetical protein
MQNNTIKALFLFLSIPFFFQTAAMAALTDSAKKELISALVQVESRGNDRAIGDRGKGEKAYGALQIRKPCVDDVNRVAGTRHRAEDMLGNRALSVWVCQKYLETYAAPKWLGHEPTLEDMARIWNGGPSGWKRASTNGYWVKVKKALAIVTAKNETKNGTMLATIK